MSFTGFLFKRSLRDLHNKILDSFGIATAGKRKLASFQLMQWYTIQELFPKVQTFVREDISEGAIRNHSFINIQNRTVEVIYPEMAIWEYLANVCMMQTR